MGLGKTLTTILHLWTLNNEPGMSLVLCPASPCTQWVQAIGSTFEKARRCINGNHIASGAFGTNKLTGTRSHSVHTTI